MNGIEKPGAVSLWDHRSPMGFTGFIVNASKMWQSPSILEITSLLKNTQWRILWVLKFKDPYDPYDPSNTNLRPL